VLRTHDVIRGFCVRAEERVDPCLYTRESLVGVQTADERLRRAVSTRAMTVKDTCLKDIRWLIVSVSAETDVGVRTLHVYGSAQSDGLRRMQPKLLGKLISDRSEMDQRLSKAPQRWHTHISARFAFPTIIARTFYSTVSGAGFVPHTSAEHTVDGPTRRPGYIWSCNRTH